MTAVSGSISGVADQTVSSVSPNPSFPGPAYSPDGSFIYNNLYHPSGLSFDIDGLLFATMENPGGYWNLWGNSPGGYSLWGSAEFVQLPDRRKRNPRRGRRARVIHLGDARNGVRGAWRRRPRSGAAAGGESLGWTPNPVNGSGKKRLIQF